MLDVSENLEKLNNQRGFIYLLLLGREKTGKDIYDEIKNLSLIQDAGPRIYALINQLEKEKLVFIARKRGKAKYRTASLDPLKAYYRKKDLPFGEKEHKLVKITAKYISFFSRYLDIHFEHFKLHWKRVNYEFLFTKYGNFQGTLMGISTGSHLYEKTPLEENDAFKILLRSAEVNMNMVDKELQIRDLLKKELSNDDIDFLRGYFLDNKLPKNIKKLYEKALKILDGLV